jgi:ABC-type bacteriocin/lantibiotic exporter with double-glycine peptidase domain
MTRRIRFVPQMERAECGAACLAMVLDRFGRSTTLAETRAACAVGRDGVDARTMIATAAVFGLRGRGFFVDLVGLGRLDRPAVLHWDHDHFVVLERLGARRARIVDPASGRRVVTIDELARRFTGVAITFAPAAGFVRRPRPPGPVRQYLARSLAHGASIGFVLACALLLEILGLLFPATSQLVVDQVVIAGHHGWLFAIAAALGLAGIARVAFQWLRDGVLRRLHLVLELDLLGGFVDHLLRLPLQFFHGRSPGDLVQRVRAQRGLAEASTQLSIAFLDVVLVVGYAGLLLAYDVRVAAVAIVGRAARIVGVMILGKRARELAVAEQALRAREYAALVEALGTLESVEGLGLRTTLLRRHLDRRAARVAMSLRIERRTRVAPALLGVLDGLCWAGVLWLGGSAVIAGEMTVGVFAGVLAAQALLDAPLAALGATVSSWFAVEASMPRIDDVLRTEVAVRDRELPPSSPGVVVLRGASFRYGEAGGDRANVVDGVDLVIPPGATIALVGRSGHGKTTVGRLVAGLLSPTAGAVEIDGVPASQLHSQTRARHIGVVFQGVTCLAGSLLENIRLRRPDAGLDQVMRATRLAALDDVVARLPDGFETRIGAGASSLSGGELQRVAIARAILGDPTVLVLDEATSALDPETEARVMSNLASMRCTKVVITHRPAGLAAVDLVAVVEHGRIVEHGTVASLVAAGGRFTELFPEVVA